jgi:hypothetical protein
MLLAVAAVLVVFVIAASVFLVNVAGAILNNQTTSRPEPPPVANPREAANAREIASLRSQRDQFQKVLGGLVTSHYYQAYLNIGLLGDSVDTRTYTDAETKTMFDKLSRMLDAVDQELDKLRETDLEPGDWRDFERVHTLSPLLKEEMRLLRVYFQTRTKEDAERYRAARTNTWNNLSTVLGLKGE